MADNDGLVSMGNQFSGLDMSALIGGPLRAACDAQVMLAASTSKFIEDVGMVTDGNGVKTVRTTNFSFTRASTGEGAAAGAKEEIKMNVPLLSIVNIPSLQVDNVDVKFDMEVKSAVSSENEKKKEGQLDADASLKAGPFSMNVKIKGSISSSEKNTRSSDNSAKYHVEVHAAQAEPPEGLSRMLDMLATACAPVSVEEKKPA